MHLRAAKYTKPEAFIDHSGASRAGGRPLSVVSGNNNNHQFTASNVNLNFRAAQAAPLPVAADLASLYDYLERAWAGRSRTIESMNRYNHDHYRDESSSSKHDKIKLMELSIINLVELSALAAEQGRLELALNKAKEALEALNSLKATMMQDSGSSRASNPLASLQRAAKSDSQQQKQQQPMTTGVRLFELLLMVNSNLAAQLKNNGHLNEALDLYTELCKMANSGSNQHDAKLLLHRFGLNIGNVLYSMSEYSRALKYYRLTLDRLSASSGQQNLRMKLMNNIAITQIAMGNQSDAITSLNLLLTDNLSQVNNSNSDTRNVTTIRNGNHHSFALNLMVCRHQQAPDACSSILSTLKSLVKADICHQYERVFDLDLTWLLAGRSQAADSASAVSETRNSSHARERRNRCRPESRAKSRAGGTDSGRASDGQPSVELVRQQITANDRKAAARVEAEQTLSSSAIDRPTIGSRSFGGDTASSGQSEGEAQVGQWNSSGSRLTKLSAAEKSRQVMGAIREDRLEMLIDGKHRQISRAFILASKLLELTSGPGNRSIEIGTSAFHYCMKLLSTSETYKSLVCDFRTNKLGEMLGKSCNLEKAKLVLEQMETEQERQLERSLALNSAQKTIFMSSSSSTKSNVILKSSFLHTNICLLNLWKEDSKKAIEYGELALKADTTNAQTLLNLANCYFLEDDLDEAEGLNERAISINSDYLEAHYNTLLIHRKRGRHYDELSPSTKAFLSKTVNTLFQTNTKMVLSQVQLAQMLYNSQQYHQSLRILSDLVASSRQAPELYLMSCKSQENMKGFSPASCTAILQQANQDHPYNLPILERLIAYNIESFNYKKAELLLADCIKIRPDQHKWYQMLAECYRRAAEYNKAIAVYKSAVEKFPQETSCLRSLIKLYDELGLEGEKKTMESMQHSCISLRSHYPYEDNPSL